MEALSMLFSGFADVLQPANILFLFGGVAVGLVLGAIPGLTATMAIALVIPLTYYLSPTQSLVMLLAAYNAGIGNVDGWLSDPEQSQDGRTLVNIPFPETAAYVEKVQKNRNVYRKLYGYETAK